MTPTETAKMPLPVGTKFSRAPFTKWEDSLRIGQIVGDTSFVYCVPITASLVLTDGYDLLDKAELLRLLRLRDREFHHSIERLQCPPPLYEYVPQTAGDAVIQGWIQPGEIEGYEWDNRTTAENARWMLEKLLKHHGTTI